MATSDEAARFAAWLRDRAYDTVFHFGDTALQFVADLFRGPKNLRRDSYDKRQAGMQERKQPAPTTKSSSHIAPSIIIHAKEGQKAVRPAKAKKQMSQQKQRRR